MPAWLIEQLRRDETRLAAMTQTGSATGHGNTQQDTMSKGLAGKSAIVTGGAGGIGSATAQLFCEQGARVALVDSDAAACEASAERIRSAVPGAELLALQADVSREAEAIDTVALVTGA